MQFRPFLVLPMASTTVSKSIFVASYMLRSNFAPTKRTAETPTNKSSAWTAPLFWALPPSTSSSTLTPRAKLGSSSSNTMPHGFGRATS